MTSYESKVKNKLTAIRRLAERSKDNSGFVKALHQLNASALNNNIRYCDNPSFYYDEIEQLRSYIILIQDLASEGRINSYVSMSLSIAVKEAKRRKQEAFR